MKRIINCMIVLAGAVFAASCQQESFEPESSAGVLTYTIQMPGALNTKSIGDNVSSVNELVYEVYLTEATQADDHSTTETRLYQKKATVDNGTATVSLELVKNQNFRVLFWAQVKDNGIYTTSDLKNVTLTGDLKANNEAYAVFAGADYIKAGDLLKGRTITLKRPVSQLNIATTPESLVLGEGSDIKTDVKISTTEVTVSGLSRSYNVSQAAPGEISDMSYTYAAESLAGLSENTITVNGDIYRYVAMNYVGFAEVEGNNTKVTYDIVTENVGKISNVVENVPMKPNFRTNIIGNLITSTSDYTVTLDNEWAGAYSGPDFSASPDNLQTSIKEAVATLTAGETRIIALSSGTYSEDIVLTVAELGNVKGNLIFEPAVGATPVITGTVTLGYRNQGVGAAMFNVDVTFDGITFDHAAAATHSLDIQDVKSLTLKNCKIVGDGEYGITCARGNATGSSRIEGCTFENAGAQLLGNFATGLVIDNCTFNESCINVQAGNGVTVQNCTFNNTLTSAHVGESFYLVRSNSTPITVEDCIVNIDSELSAAAVAQAKWGIFWNRGTTNWTVNDVTVKMSGSAAIQTSLEVTKCTNTGVINATNLTVDCYASSSADLTCAVSAGVTEIYVEGEFKMPSFTGSANVTINGVGNAVIDNTLGSYWDSSTLTFNNVNFKTGTGMANGNGSDYAALYSKNVTYNECNFSGPMRLGRDGAKFVKCTFNDLGNDYVWTYGNAASFERCTFNSEGKALLIYSDGGGKGAPAVSVTGCTFNATQGAKAGAIANQDCAAIEIHNYGNGVTLTASENSIDSDFSGEWRIKKYENRYPESKIFVNGTEYTTIALDGKTMTIDSSNNVTVNE